MALPAPAEAAYWGWQATTTFGPGLAFCAVLWLAINAVGRLITHIEYRRDVAANRRALAAERRQEADERRQMAALLADLDATPLIPTQPGHDQQALDECNAIWDRSREEDPQP